MDGLSATLPGSTPPDPTPYVRIDDDGTASLHLMVEGAHCAVCIQKIESGLTRQPGVVDARLNLTTRRLVVRWRNGAAGATGAAGAADLVNVITGMGYRAMPFDPDMLATNDAAETHMMLRYLAVAGFAAANVMLLSVAVWAGAFSSMGPATRGLLHWVSALIVLPALAYACRPFIYSAWRALRVGTLNMDVPISLAILLTAAMSLAETIRGGEHVYFDASAMLVFFLLIGRYLDRGARAKARSAAEKLSVLGSASANVIGDDGALSLLPVASVRPGMMIAVAMGERVPVDGDVIAGNSEIDSSLVTGETLPRPVGPGEPVFAGTLNLAAPLRLRATAADDQTLLAEIVRLMEAAQQGRARYVRLADRAAKIYAPAVHVLALATFIFWFVFGGLDWQSSLLVAISVLIITCPCALGLAVPVVQVVASGRLMKRGILLKSPDGLERLAEIDHVVFDKTGTLTHGRPALINMDTIYPADLRLAASLAAASSHPLCRALVAAAGAGPLAENVREEPGMGLVLETGGGDIRLGNGNWCAIDQEQQTAGPRLWLTQPDRPPIRFDFSDRARSDALETVAKLRRRGYGVELLSGDRAEAVANIARAVGIDDYRAETRPAGKTDRLAALALAGHKTVMIGDGLNDAPALAAAFASISPADASDISRTAADVLFQGGALAPIVETLDVARRSRALMLQNFGLALAYNAVAVPLAMAGQVTPLYAAIAMSASSLLVTLNALRLYLDRP